jgi:hypothetical protein
MSHPTFLRTRFALLLGILIVVGVILPNAGAADLKAKFVLDGDVPAEVPILDPKVATEFPGAKLVYEQLVVDPMTIAIANVAVYVRDDNFPATPAAEAGAAQQVVIDNKGGRFEPHMSAVWVGKQKLFFTNSDPVSHNGKFDVAAFNQVVPPGGRVEVPLTETRLLPQTLACSIHPWMTALVVARKNPYVAISGANGTLEIKDLPEGTAIEFQAWHERSGYLNVPAWPKGRFTMTLKAGVNDLGEIKVPLKILNK